jgi:acetyl esterase/lipase
MPQHALPPLALPLLALALAACGPDGEGPTAHFDPQGAFFDAPWPSDARRTDAGAPDWSAFPNPAGLALVDTVLDRASSRPGHALNAPVYLRFDAEIDVETLPAPPDTTASSSPIQLLDVDPRSPDFLRRVPIQFAWHPEQGAYLPGNLLAVSPLDGIPLRPGTTYALIVLDAWAEADPRFTEAWTSDGPWGEALAPLDDVLGRIGLYRHDVAAATVFTTTEPLAEMDRVARFLDERVTPPAFEPALGWVYNEGAYEVWRSSYSTPIFMQGEAPYADAGGAFAFRDDGLPEIARWEPMRLSVILPADRAAPPEGGWPVVVSLHGTGGDWLTVAGTDSSYEIAQWATELGAVVLSIDLPLHGTRGTPDTIIDLHSFNVLQPDSALHIHRQAAADTLYLLHGVAQAPAFTLPSGETVSLDPGRVALIGHSQGGLTSAIAAPWAGELVDGVMMSGTGGLLAITAVERDSDYDFPTIIRSLLSFDEDEPLTETHPALGLVQSLVEVTDPINYGRAWFSEDAGLHGAKPVPVLLTSGLRDDMTPFRTAQALASAARVPFAGKRYADAPANVLRGLDSQPMPLSGNVMGWDGAPITAAFAQYDSGDHFVIFYQDEARDVTRNFIASTLSGSPTVRRGDP